VAAIPIGTGAAVGAAIARWRQSVAAARPAPGTEASAERVSGRRLRRLVWDPLLPHLGEPTRVVIVPDGEVNLVSFAALPSGRTTYLAEDGPALHHLAAERDLVPRETTQTATGLLAVGGISFGTAPAPSASSQRADLTFRPLPATATEIREVAAMFPGGEATTLSGTAATSEAFGRLAAGKRVVHVATHGFFLNAPFSVQRGATRGVGGLTVRRRARAEGDALLLSGLAFANANRAARAPAGQDDGVLTAEEVAGLDLQGTEWAVLSACDTGLGRMTTGEGVLGLRRAFQVAGARTVIMSLWSVDDDATRRWMRALYEGRLTKGLSTAESVQHANVTLLRERRAKKLSTHPFYWAAFVASGDWR
jgi:CHAT domain-containing protein